MKKTVLILSFLINLTVYAAPRIETEPPILPDKNFSSISVQDELITKKLEVTGSAIICKKAYLCDVTIGDNLLIKGNLSVDGTSTLSGSALLTDLTVTGNTDLTDLTVTGDTFLNNLTASGDTVLNTGTVTGNFTIGGTLFANVGDFSSLSTTNDADIGCNLTVGCNIFTQNTTTLIGAYYKGGVTWLHNFGNNNVFLGAEAGNFTLTGGAAHNVGIGDFTLHGLTSGTNNTVLGFLAGTVVNSGSNNIIIGNGSGDNLTSGSGNIYINSDAATTAESNTIRIGIAQTRNFQVGIRNITPVNTDTAIVSIDSANQLGTGIIYNNANFANTTATQGAILKNGLPWLHNFGTANTFLGIDTGNFTLTGTDNIGIGDFTLNGLTSGSFNTILGAAAGETIGSGSANIVIGAGAGGTLTSGSGNIYIGANGATNAESNTIRIGTSQTSNFQVGIRNITPVNTDTAIVSIDSGNQLGTGRIYNDVDFANTTATQGAILKAGLLWLHNTGTGNVFLGVDAGNRTTTGSENIGMGNSALTAITNGQFNIGIGSSSLTAMTGGQGNIALGFSSLAAITNGQNNVAIGSLALVTLLTTGNQSQNTAIGGNALIELQGGTNNTAVGYNAGSSIFTGSNNIYIGNPGQDLDSGIVRIGTSGTHVSTIIQGTVFLPGLFATSTPNPVLQAGTGGQVEILISSRRFKKNIEPISDEAAQRFMQLQPVRYNAIEDASQNPRPVYGFIAEDVNNIMPELVINDADGKPLTIGYVVMHALLLKLIQDQEEKIYLLEQQNTTKHQNISALNELIESLIARIIVLENAHK